MLLRTAVGHAIRSYCILDSDFHTPTQIAARKTEAREKGVNLHIWKKKEVENYFLVPDAILRTIAARTRDREPRLTTALIGQKLFEFAGELEHEVMDALAAEYSAENRAGGFTAANRLARERMRSHWTDPDGRLALVSGKQVLARLSEWTQANYGVSISVLRIARQMLPTEIDDELMEVLAAIENNEPFRE
jgi:hypothetical protein